MADGPGFTITDDPLSGHDSGDEPKERQAGSGIGIKTAPASEQLILSPSAPILSARQFIARQHTQEEVPTLHHQNGTFFRWQGSHYVEWPAEEVRAQLYAFLDGAKRLNADNEIVPFDPTKYKVGNIAEALAAESQLPASIRAPAWLDDASDRPAAADLIACSNGLLSLHTMVLHPRTPLLYNLNALDFPYDPAALAPAVWLRFLATVWPDDPDAVATLQEIFGLLLTANTAHQKAFLIVGPKRSGKGTIARVLSQMLGAANVCSPTLDNLGANFGMAPLIGKRLAIVSDARLAGRSDQTMIVERFLSVTGEDSMTIDRKFRDPWTGKLGARFLITTNELPRLHDSSGAFASRFLILRMIQSFYGREDMTLGAKLPAELPGILLWAIEGWRRLTARGYFVQPVSSRSMQQELEDLGSPICVFLRDRCQTGLGLAVQASELYAGWCHWCEQEGQEHPGTTQTFGAALRAAVPGLEIKQRRINGVQLRFYDGLTLIH